MIKMDFESLGQGTRLLSYRLKSGLQKVVNETILFCLKTSMGTKTYHIKIYIYGHFSCLGVSSLKFKLPKMAKDGYWKIRIKAWGQLEEQNIKVETYFPPLFEVRNFLFMHLIVKVI